MVRIYVLEMIPQARPTNSRWKANNHMEVRLFIRLIMNGPKHLRIRPTPVILTIRILFGTFWMANPRRNRGRISASAGHVAFYVNVSGLEIGHGVFFFDGCPRSGSLPLAPAAIPLARPLRGGSLHGRECAPPPLRRIVSAKTSTSCEPTQTDSRPIHARSTIVNMQESSDRARSNHERAATMQSGTDEKGSRERRENETGLG